MKSGHFETLELWVRKSCESRTTERSYRARLNQFLGEVKTNPDEIVAEWKKVRYDWKERQKFIDKWNEKIENYYCLLELAPASRVSYVTPIISFFHRYKIPVEIEYDKHVFIKYHNRDIKKEEIKAILEHSGLRDKTFFLIMAESGQRPNTLVQLRYKHIKEDFEAERIPMKIDLPPQILKDRVGKRVTFIGEDAFNSLKEYLSTRIPLDDNEVIFQPEKPFAKSECLSPESFGNKFSRVALKLKLTKIEEKGKPKPLRLYCLRKYFRKYCRPEDISYREFWMAHSLGTDEHYISRDVEDQREMYREAYPRLRIYERMHATKAETTGQAKEITNLRQQVKDLQQRLEIRQRATEYSLKEMRKNIDAIEAEQHSIREAEQQAYEQQQNEEGYREWLKEHKKKDGKK